MSMDDITYVRAVEQPALSPPASTVGIVAWLRTNLFSSPGNTVTTLIAIALIALILPPIVRWAFIDAVWTGEDRTACAVPEAGACWAWVRAKFAQFIYGRYPIPERWRVDLVLLLFAAGLIPMAIPRVPYKRENVIYMLVVFPVLAFILLVGGVFGLRPVETALWGGLLVTLVVAIVGMVASLPLGMLLALGRRSRMPVIRLLSICFIEFWRGVPLITVSSCRASCCRCSCRPG
jgi:general L-amino acid transport system permease protein